MDKKRRVTLVTYLVSGVCYLQTATYAQPINTFVNSLGMKFVRIEPGSFQMGQQEGGDWDERPVHRVTISESFFMAVTEVTNAQYEQFDPKHREFRGQLGYSKQDDEAVVFVSWHEANNFCQWLSKKEGKPYRLPTEAEWEYACRAGTTTAYHTGDSLPDEFHKNVGMSWFPDPARSRKEAEPVPLIVEQTPPNPWGLFDMHGNVEEWCADWYGPYEPTAQTDPVGRIDEDFKVTRGSSHSTEFSFLRSANRSGTLPDDKSWLIGFRVVLGVTPKTEPLPVLTPTLNRQNVNQQFRPDWSKGPDYNQPYFKGPIEYVKIIPGSDGPMYSKHNHDPALVDCPNGDLLAIWYSCRNEPGRELTILASRLRYGEEQWEPASVFWNAPDRNDHAPALFYDGWGAIYHFNGLSAAATWGNLATIMRTSTDSGATWSRARLINTEHNIRHMPVESAFRTREGFILLPCDAVTGGRGGSSVHISRDQGKTWVDPGAGRPNPTFAAGTTGAWIAGIHAGVTQLKDGRLMAFGRGDNIDGRMPMSISEDMGKSWTYSASEFPPLGGGQRLILKRLQQGPILFISFTDRKKGMIIRDQRVFGMFAALSFDEGKTWPVKRLITDGGPAREVDGGGNTGKFIMDQTHAEPRGYLAATQTPDGLIHLISSKQYYTFNLAWLQQGAEVKPSRNRVNWPVPGVIIDYSPAKTKRYIGSPSIAALPNGHYVASHDFFGPGTKMNRTAIFRSEDAGKTWRKLTELDGQFWSSLFVHKRALYIIGTSRQYGQTVIRRSTDEGQTWTTPNDERSGLLMSEGEYHCAPVPVVVHNGRIWRAMEDRNPPEGWGENFRSFAMSADVNADLLKADSWTVSNRLRFNQAWSGRAWLEGNIVVTPQNTLVNILRVENKEKEIAAIVHVSKDGKSVSFDPEKDFIHFYGGTNKFTIRFDPVTNRYWSLVNKEKEPQAYRNNLVLVSSSDIKTWKVESVILRHPDSVKHGFQYIDWLFEGDDIIAVSRTAFDDGRGGAHRAHDANYLTFHRIENFRDL
ncbi:MAG: SUMF1/EgtB/PvdO family nonheme iron enzyme [Sedimentisphaerales bacterium]|nr:SUMF1/EgtB/PvdO family nonheme iron enzyme [Sedimentisphaerales bacterium]